MGKQTYQWKYLYKRVILLSLLGCSIYSFMEITHGVSNESYPSAMVAKMSSNLLPMSFVLRNGTTTSSTTSGYITSTAISSTITSNTPRRKGLIILTNYRSGSSFLGQYFNQRTDSFYLYEPLMPFGYCGNESLQVEYLRKLFHCDIIDQSQLFQSLNKMDEVLKIPGYSPLKRCLSQNVCFREHIKQFCSLEYCGKESLSCEGCPPINTAQLSRECKTASIVVVKLIRFCRLESLKPLFEDSTLDIKILQLVRDPRGIYNSAARIVKEEEAFSRVSQICKRNERNWLTAINDKNTWLKETYKLVRYEDVCRQPLDTAEKLYKFVGVGMTEKVKEWIIINSQANFSKIFDEKRNSKLKILSRYSSMKRKIPFALTLSSKEEAILKANAFQNPYTTIRNSSANWRKWTTSLSYTAVVSIQEACISMMPLFNYVPLTDSNQLRDPFFMTAQDFFYINGKIKLL